MVKYCPINSFKLVSNSSVALPEVWNDDIVNCVMRSCTYCPVRIPTNGELNLVSPIHFLQILKLGVLHVIGERNTNVLPMFSSNGSYNSNSPNLLIK